MTAPDPAVEREPAIGRARILFWLALLVVAALAVYNDFHKVMWTDEAYSLDTVSGSLSRAFHQALHYELQPPLYFLLLRLWRRLGDSIEVARLLSTFLALGTVAVLYQVQRTLRLSGRYVSLPLLAALCPYLLWAASEARGYALTLFLTSCATYFYVRLLTAPPGTLKRPAVMYILTWLAALLTFYYSGFVLAAQVIATAAVRRRLAVVTGCAFVIGLLLLPWVPTILGQIRAHPIVDPQAAVSAAGVLERAWQGLGWAFRFVLEAVYVAPALRRPIVLAVLAALIAGIVVVLWRGRRQVTDPLLAVFAVTTLVPLGVLFLGKSMGLLGVEFRYLGIVVASLLVLLALVAERFPWPPGRAWLAIGFTLFGALSVVSFQRLQAGYEDWRSAAGFVGSRERPGETVFVFEPDAVLPFRYYYRGHRPVVGLPIERPTDVYSVERQALQSPAQVDTRLCSEGGDSTYWVVARHQHPAFGGLKLREYLRTRATPLELLRVPGIEVGRYRRTTPCAIANGAGSGD